MQIGITGKVNTLYEEDLITYNVCVQGSTYNHLIPPLPSDSDAAQMLPTNLFQPAKQSYVKNVQAAAVATASGDSGKMVEISRLEVMTSLLVWLLGTL